MRACSVKVGSCGLSGFSFRGGEVILDDAGDVFSGYAGVPDVVGEDEDHGSLLVAAGAGVPKDHGLGEPPPLDLVPEGLQKLLPALLSAAALPGGCADEDLAKNGHGEILSRVREKSSRSHRRPGPALPPRPPAGNARWGAGRT